MRHRIRIRTVCGEGLTKLLRSTCVCLHSICDNFHKSKYLLFLFFCRRIPTSQWTILQNLKQFKLINLYLQGFEDWSCGHWYTYLTPMENRSHAQITTSVPLCKTLVAWYLETKSLSWCRTSWTIVVLLVEVFHSTILTPMMSSKVNLL
jgi:hypothetical protein